MDTQIYTMIYMTPPRVVSVQHEQLPMAVLLTFSVPQEPDLGPGTQQMHSKRVLLNWGPRNWNEFPKGHRGWQLPRSPSITCPLRRP